MLFFVLFVSHCPVFGAGTDGADKDNSSKLLATSDTTAAGDNLGRGNTHFSRGELLLKQGLQDSAVTAYETALEYYLKADDSFSQGNALLRIGEVAVRKGDSARALAVFTRCLACYEKSGNSAALANIHASLANLATIMGDAALKQGKYSEALHHFNKGLEYAGRDTSDAALLHREKASALIGLKEADRARESIAAALTIYEKIGDFSACATLHKMLGELYFRGGDYPEAINSFARAESLFRRLGDWSGAGNALRRMGDCFFFGGKTAQALENYEAALSLFSKTNDVRGQAGIFRVSGEIFLQQGASTRALQQFGKALGLFEQTGDVAGMKAAYRGQADALMRMGDKAKALELQAKSDALANSADNLLERANKARVQADIYFRAGDNDMAMEWYGNALTLYRNAKDLSGEGNVIRAFGDVHVQVGDYELALQKYAAALPILEKTGDQSGQGNIYLMQGYIANMQGDSNQALQLFARALGLFDVSRNQPGRINVMKSQADVHAARLDFDKATSLYQSVLDFYTSAGDLESQAYTLFGMAQIAVREGQKEKALQLYENALALLEKIRTQTGFSRLKKKFMDKIYDLYEEAVVFMIRNNFSVEAMRNAEAMKARVFIDQLAEGQVDIKNGEPPAAREKRESLEAELAALERKIAAVTRSGESGASLHSLVKLRAETEKELDALTVNLRVINPLYASVRYPQPVPVKELQQKILNSDETLLEFFVSSEGVYCFVVTVNSLTAVKLPLARKELEQLSKDLLDTVAKGPSRTSSQFEDIAATFYERLLAPLEKLIHNNTVIIVPDGVLAKVPFEILCRRDRQHSRFFLELNPIKYFQSATLLALQRSTFRKEKFSNSFIGFGDPVYDYTSPEGNRSADVPQAALSLPDASLPRLEASGKEIKAISEIFEAENLPATVLLQGKANRKHAMSGEMKEYGFIHFAAHGVKYAGYQAIALSRSLSPPDSGLLTISDIMSSSYEKSRIVVLSACQSGLGIFDRGEGITGLTRAVMYSGSPAAVVSLWNVADSATMSLMENFYENAVSKKMKLDQALRSAKLAMINSGNLRHPIFWGAFVMYGD